MDSTTMSTFWRGAANCRCSRVVFVDNISFLASENELRDAYELIGPMRPWGSPPTLPLVSTKRAQLALFGYSRFQECTLLKKRILHA